jgi:hypothetical protein
MSRPIHSVLCSAILGCCLVAGAPTTATAGTIRVTLLVTSATGGRLEDASGRTAADLAAWLEQLAEEARSAGSTPVVLDAGRTLGPYAESRGDRGRTMLEVLRAADCAAFAPDSIDLAIADSDLEFGAPVAVVWPLGAVPPAGGSHVLTLALESDLTLAVMSAMPESRLAELAEVGVLELTAPSTTPERDAATGDLNILVVQSDGHGADPTNRELTWSWLRDPQGVDLVLDPDFGQAMVMRRDGDNGVVFAAGRDRDHQRPWDVWRLELELEASGSGWVIRSLDAHEEPLPAGVAIDRDLELRVQARLQDFRRTLDSPLSAAAPPTREAAMDFVLESLREAAGAEIAVVNRGGLRPVDPRWFDAGSRREAMVRLLSLDQFPVQVVLTGVQLRALVDESRGRIGDDGDPRSDALTFAGVRWVAADGETTAITVNGRPVIDDDRYRVATTSYLVAGGDGYSVLSGIASKPVLNSAGESAELRTDIVMPRLEDVDRPFADLEPAPVWRWGVDRLAFGLDGLTVDRSPSYDDVADSRASADDSQTLRAETRVFATRQLPSWRWENVASGRLGLVSSGDEATRETDDDLRFDSSAVMTSARLLGGASPYVGLILDTEIRRNTDDAGRLLPRQLEESMSAGLTWSLPRWPRIRIGGVSRHYGHTDRSDQLGLMAEVLYHMAPAGRLGLDGRLTAESLSDGSDRTQRFELDLRLLAPMWGNLALAPGVNWYRYDESDRDGASTSLRYLVTFSWSGHGRLQRR